MYAPRVSPPVPIPGSIRTLLFTSAGFLLAISAWGVLSLRSAGNQPDRFVPPRLDWTQVRSSAFLVTDGATVRVVVHAPTGNALPRQLASFETPPGIQARGAASPLADRVAVVHAVSHASANLSIVDTADGSVVTSPLLVDTNTAIAWTRDGDSLVVSQSNAPDASGRVTSTLALVDAGSGEMKRIATFEGVYRVAPVGFSLNGARVFLVILDSEGTSLWAIEDGEPARIASISPGRTRDWALSPDGTMLAYIDVRSGDSVPSIGRAIFTANGAPVPVHGDDAAQEGVTWRPGATMPGFGGPGGNLQIESGDRFDGAYVIPEAWSPDGSRLVARVVSPSLSGETSTVTWELLIAPDPAPAAAPVDIPARSVIYDGPAEVTFLGWVRNAPAIPAKVQE